MNLVFDSVSNDIRFISIFKKNFFDDREREQGLDHSEFKTSKFDKMTNTCSIELKIPSLKSVWDQHSYKISFIWIVEKKIFDENFSKSRIFNFQSVINLELLTRSSSIKRRWIWFSILIRMISVSFEYSKKNFLHPPDTSNFF